MIIRRNMSDCAKAVRLLNNYARFQNCKFFVVITDNHLHLNCIQDGVLIEDIMRRYHQAYEDFILDIICFRDAVMKIEAAEAANHEITNRLRYKTLWNKLRKRELLKS